MDSVIEEIPNSYFDSSKSKLNKHHSKVKKKHRLSTHKASVGMKDSDKKRGFLCIIIVNIVNFVLLSILFFLYMARRYNTVEEVYCPVGFFGNKCQRNDFIDVVAWSSEQDITSVDGECTSGYSFRTWAPGAHQVRLVFKNKEDPIFSYYPMIQQDMGFWFILVCSCRSGAQYKFQVDYDSAQESYSLSLGSVERTMFTQEVSNILVDSTKVEGTSHYVPFPQHPIVYHIHVPTYIQSAQESPLDTISARLQTMRLIGANVLELSGIEFLNCDEDKLTCWQGSSYSPGLLRPSLGSMREWIQLIQTIHQYNMSVVIDLNWEMFNKNSLLWSYHKHFQNYKEMNNTSGDVGDVFRSAEYCNEDQCPLDLSGNSLNQLVLYSVLKRYRNTFQIDGLRFLVNQCSRFVGGDCSRNRSNRDDSQNDAVLHDFWSLIRGLGFEIITSDKTSVPDYDFYLDTTVCDMLSEVKTSDNLYNPIMTIANYGINTDRTLISPECHHFLNNRLYVRTNYQTASILQALFYFVPADLHFFMGTPFMSEVPFTAEPQRLDLENVGYTKNSTWFNSGYKLSKLSMTIDLMAIRSNYTNDLYQFEKLNINTKKGEKVVCFKAGSPSKPLFILINYGRALTGWDMEVQSFHPYNVWGKWKTLFTTANTEYDTNLGNTAISIQNSKCKNTANVKEFVCYTFYVPELSFIVFEPIDN